MLGVAHGALSRHDLNMTTILITLLMLVAHAQSVNVISLKGFVTAGPAGKMEPVKIGTSIPTGSTVKTATGASAILLFPDQSRVKLKGDTELVIHAPANPQEKTGVDLVLGAVFSMVTKKTSQNFKVVTPVAVAGVRGTQFFTSFDRKMWMCVQEGEVEMTSEASTAVVVKAGEGIFAEKGKTIQAPKKYEWTKNLNWNMDPTKGDVIDNTVIDDSYNMLKKSYD